MIAGGTDVDRQLRVGVALGAGSSELRPVVGVKMQSQQGGRPGESSFHGRRWSGNGGASSRVRAKRLFCGLFFTTCAPMSVLDIKPADQCRYDMIALGEIMLRMDPGDGRVRTARQFDVWEGGGEYNVARGLRRCFGLKTAW